MSPDSGEPRGRVPPFDDSSWDLPERDAEAPIALDSIGYGMQGLDAIVVVHLGDAHVHAAFVREGAGISPPDVAGRLCDCYRSAELAAQRIARFSADREAATALRASMAPPGARDREDDVPGPVVTLELPAGVGRDATHAERSGGVMVLRRVRAYAVACVFDAAVPLGMARLLSHRVTTVVSPELPFDSAVSAAAFERPFGSDPPRPPPPPRVPPPARAGTPPSRVPSDEPPRASSRAGPRASESGPPRRAGPTPTPPHVSAPEIERTLRLLAFFDAKAPEPHVARLRLALRAGLSPLALEQPEALGPETVLLIETAVEDILGLDRAALRRRI